MSSRRPDAAALPTREALLASFADRPDQSRSLRTLLKQHHVPPAHRQAMRRLLEQLVREGRLTRHSGLRFQLAGTHHAHSTQSSRERHPAPTGTVAPLAVSAPIALTGRLWRHPDGYGFVAPAARPNDPEIFITRQGMGNALHGDLVQVKLVEFKGHDQRPQRGGRRGGRAGRRSTQKTGSGRSGGRGPTGRIVRVIERARPRIVGRFQSGPRGGVVMPVDERLSMPLPVAPSSGRSGEGFPSAAPTVPPASIAPGSLVIGELPSTGQLSLRVVRDFGTTDDPRMDTELILEEFGWPTAFSAEAEREAVAFGAAVPAPVGARRDLRALPTVTIDGEQARDFDDAISVERISGGYRLWVHVADVGHYVDWDSALDSEARVRGTSVYFPDRAVPMLPERLSNGLCSLNPHEDRAAMTVEMEWGHDGRALKASVYESVIKSDARLTYPGVAAALQAPSHGENGRTDGVAEPYRSLRPMLQLAAEVADRLRRNRMARGSLDFDLPEPEILLDLQGRPTDILREERTMAHRLIEECMLAANEAVAVHLTRLDVPMLYRIHEPPDPRKLAAFNHFAKGFGYTPPSSSEALKSPITLQGLLETARGRPEERLLNHLLLRSMKRARYGPEAQGHFGLASECYTHFTSPIRRYPDLVVHRILKQVLREGPPSGAARERLVGLLPELGQRSSDRERLSMEAEWEVVNVKKARFMLGRIGETYRGFITGVARFGLFVELENIFVEGLIPARTLPKDQYHFDEAQHTLMGVRHRYRLADQVTVQVTGVDLDRRRVNFTLKEVFVSP
jgi:ribonuclease R